MVAEDATEPIAGENEEWTLVQQGPILPIGIQTPEGFNRTIEVRPWRLKEERELGELRDKNKKATAFQFASMVLGTLCTKLGPNDFTESSLKMPKKQAAVGQMFLGDVLYAYLWLRHETLGSTLEMQLSCPACGKSYAFNADLDTLPVSQVESLEDAMWDYELKDPFPVRSDVANKLTFGPIRWSTFEGVAGAGAMKTATIVGSLYKINDKATPISKQELDEMSKRDLEAIIRMIDDHHIGPDMSLDMVCPHCSHEYKTVIDWSTDSFFGVSGAE